MHASRFHVAPSAWLPIIVLILTVGGACTQRNKSTEGAVQDPPGKTATPASDASSDGKTLQVGIVPAVDVGKVKEIYGPWVREISTALARPVTLHIASDYDSLRNDMTSGRVHFAQVSAYLYVATAMQSTREGRPLHVLAQEHRLEDNRYNGVFVVPQQSPVKKIGDLRGKRMVYVARSSSSGFYYPRIRLRELGHDPDTFFATTTFAGSHDAVIKTVQSGMADAGAISELSAALSGLRIIERTAAIPDDAIISLGGLTQTERAKLSRFLLAAHENPALGNFFIARGIARYVPAEIEIYKPQQQEMQKTVGVVPPAPTSAADNDAAAVDPGK